MSKFLKWAYNLNSVAKPICRKYHAVNQSYPPVNKEAPVGTIPVGNNYMDFGGVMYNLVEGKLVMITHYNDGTEATTTPSLGEVSDESIADHYEGHSG